MILNVGPFSKSNNQRFRRYERNITTLRYRYRYENVSLSRYRSSYRKVADQIQIQSFFGI